MSDHMHYVHSEHSYHRITDRGSLAINEVAMLNIGYNRHFVSLSRQNKKLFLLFCNKITGTINNGTESDSVSCFNLY